ncbi:MAG TPA: hypothetical protein VL977_04560 [Solirubrobacteraceae bacterium]|nr:hypothetical protein [Solirubrobacteraceae bacterium]
MNGIGAKERLFLAAVCVVLFGFALALDPLGAPWSWAIAIALLGSAGVLALVRDLRQDRGTRAQVAQLRSSLELAEKRIASAHGATARLAAEVERLRERLGAAERVAAESRVRLQRYDLIQRPGGFEIELYCEACNAWRPSGVISNWQQFQRDDPFVGGDGRFILSCGHEVRAENYLARPGAKMLPALRGSLAQRAAAARD